MNRTEDKRIQERGGMVKVQKLTMKKMYAFFMGDHKHLKFICQCFRTLCSIFTGG
jgi:hypothetical protein